MTAYVDHTLHLPEDVLNACCAGSLDGIEAIEAHLDTCDICRLRLVRTVRSMMRDEAREEVLDAPCFAG